MVRHGAEADHARPVREDDDLGKLIRWSLEDSLSEAQPPARVWPRILERVNQVTAPARPRRVVFPLASLVQAVVISVLLLAFGLGDHNVVMPGRQYRTTCTPSVPRSLVSEDAQDDVLRGYLLLQMEKDMTSDNARAGHTPGVDKSW